MHAWEELQPKEEDENQKQNNIRSKQQQQHQKHAHIASKLQLHGSNKIRALNHFSHILYNVIPFISEQRKRNIGSCRFIRWVTTSSELCVLAIARLLSSAAQQRDDEKKNTKIYAFIIVHITHTSREIAYSSFFFGSSFSNETRESTKFRCAVVVMNQLLLFARCKLCGN